MLLSVSIDWTLIGAIFTIIGVLLSLFLVVEKLLANHKERNFAKISFSELIRIEGDFGQWYLRTSLIIENKLNYSISVDKITAEGFSSLDNFHAPFAPFTIQAEETVKQTLILLPNTRNSAVPKELVVFSNKGKIILSEKNMQK